ncbi:MAG: hypothetical protein EON58_22710 [Alphaproteobacteria bacterium]|nr:MAG: hypothetical protein EON58_22710 [Alphaproteobacteria bacterium]
MFTVLCLVITLTYSHALVRYSASERQLSEIVETKRLEALQVRKLLDQQRKSFDATAAARTGKAQSVPITRLWEEVTRTVPDDAWISDFAFDGVSVTLSGYAEGSASLIGKLSASELLRDPAFTSPVVRALGQTGERFELRARVALP